MHIGTFTERPYASLAENEVYRNASFFGVSNKHFDPKVGAELYHRYLDQNVAAEDLGFDVIMLNEHHANPFTMGAVMDVEAAILAARTRRVKIALMGNPLPITDPLRLAEELATIDMISRGRLVAGWVRGAGSEQIANNVNPAYNRERFNEAHDFIQQAWTRPGPWRYEGKHYHYRHVNPWQKPYQQPVPECWIPGLVSPETVIWCAQHRYPYLALATFLEPTMEMWDMYADEAERQGYQAGPENFGYLQKIVVAETEEKAQELGHAWLYGGGQPAFARPEWMFPSGYNTKAATARLAKAFTNPETGDVALASATYSENIDVEAARRATMATYQGFQDSNQFIVGTPKSVLPKLRHVMETIRPGIFICWHIEGGAVSQEDAMTSLRLLGTQVLPEMRKYARELGLTSPDEVKPGSRPLPASGKRLPVVGKVSRAAE